MPTKVSDHAKFTEEMEAAGFKVKPYSGRWHWEGPAVVVEDLQEALAVTSVKCQWDNMGLNWVVYPVATS